MQKFTLADLVNMVEKAEMNLDFDLTKADTKISLREQGMDSLDFTSLIFEIESHFGVEAIDDDIVDGKWNSIEQILAMLNAQK